MLRRSRSIVRHTAIALTFKIGAAGSRRAGEIMVAVFFGNCAVCVVVGITEYSTYVSNPGKLLSVSSYWYYLPTQRYLKNRSFFVGFTPYGTTYAPMYWLWQKMVTILWYFNVILNIENVSGFCGDTVTQVSIL